MTSPKKVAAKPEDQAKAFRSAARAAECDEDEDRFRERLARVVKPDQPAEKKPVK